MNTSSSFIEIDRAHRKEKEEYVVLRARRSNKSAIRQKMESVTGRSCFMHRQIQSPSSVSSYGCYRSRKAHLRAPIVSCSQFRHHDPFCAKRTFLFITTIAFLPFRIATAKEGEVKTPEDNQKAETEPEMDNPSNSSLLDGIGILFSGVLGGLYAFARRENSTAVATIETMSRKLMEKEEQIVSLKRNYESKLLNEQEELAKLLVKAKEEQQALINQLNSANSTITRFGQELKSDKSYITELKLRIGTLETELSKTGIDKKDLENNVKEKEDSIGILHKRINLLNLDLKDKEDVVQNLNLSLAEKELKLRNLNSTYEQTKDDLSHVHFQIQGMNDELLKSQEELKAKDYLVMELSSRASSLTLENNDSRNKYDVMEQEYNDLKLTAEKKAALDAKVLREKEEELHQVKDQFEHALDEASKNQVIIADLAQEREALKESLENESKKVSLLKYELQVMHENLGRSRNESDELERHLNESNKLCKELELEVSKLSSELTKVKESLQSSLDDSKRGAEMLASELMTAKEHLKKAQAELQSMSHELTAALQNRDSLQRELINIYKMAETIAQDLKKEKELVASLKQDLQALEKQVSEDKEARRSLEVILEEATKSLDQMNRNAMILSGDLERANSLVSSLENEKEILYESLTEQRNVSKEAQENIENAHNLIMELGKEREILENRGKKLEEELAYAKGEILRLRSQTNSSKVAVSNELVQKDEGETRITANARKNSRRRKANPQ